MDYVYTIAARYEYDAFGNVTEKTGSFTPRYTFSTKEFLPAVRLYLYQYRVYDPIAGRWTQRDPIDYADSINLYQFCGNNPVNATDPDGRFPWIGACAVGFLICHIIYTKTASPISTSHVPEGHGRTVIGIGFYNPKNSPVGVSAANIAHETVHMRRAYSFDGKITTEMKAMAKTVEVLDRYIAALEEARKTRPLTQTEEDAYAVYKYNRAMAHELSTDREKCKEYVKNPDSYNIDFYNRYNKQ